MNKIKLSRKYKNLVGSNVTKFIADGNYVKARLKLQELKEEPLLIYSDNRRNAIYYIACVHHCLRLNRLLDYVVVTGQTLINQHFMSEDTRDNELWGKLYYTDIAFISLSQFDYTSEYLESLIIDLIEFRKNNHKVTIISYDTMSVKGASYNHQTKRLQLYFNGNQYPIIDLHNTKAASKRLAEDFSVKPAYIKPIPIQDDGKPVKKKKKTEKEFF